MKTIHFLMEECQIKGGGEKIKGGGFKKGGGFQKKGGNLPLFPPLAKTLCMYVILANLWQCQIGKITKIEGGA